VQSITLRMYLMKRVALLPENSVHKLSSLGLTDGRRTTNVVMTAAYGLIVAVLTTISQIDSRADIECKDVLNPADSDCRYEEIIMRQGKPFGSAMQYSWCCGMKRDGDFLSRPMILSSAAMACVAAIWGWLGCTLTRSPTFTFGGCGGLAAMSAVLLGCGAREDLSYEWILFIIIWIATLANACLMLTVPLPYLYDGAATTGGLIVSTSSLRRWVSGICALADLVLLPTVPGGAMVAMGAVLGLRAAMTLYFTVASAHCCAERAAARVLRTAQDPALRAKAAAAAMRSGLLARDGRIRAADVFEFHLAGPQEGWRWISKGGEARGQIEVRPFQEYVTVAVEGRAAPRCLGL
jgi:hypothetical protein